MVIEVTYLSGYHHQCQHHYPHVWNDQSPLTAQKIAESRNVISFYAPSTDL